MEPFSIFAPAKLNLFLAITGRRADGFHDLASVVAQLDFGDTLRVEPAAAFSLSCDNPEVPCDETNLVMKAARSFAAAARWSGGAKLFLEKRIPMGAGLGGGSSDAVATLRGLNRLVERPLEPVELNALAAQLGSDCALFLQAGPVVIRGRGERVEVMAELAAQRLRGRRVLVFKPAFGIATPWAYAQLAAGTPASYLPAQEAEARLAAWSGDSTAPAEALLFNTMEAPVFEKFLALPALLDRLRREFGIEARMSGSGSACYTLLTANTPIAPISGVIRDAWGESAFVREARLT